MSSSPIDVSASRGQSSRSARSRGGNIDTGSAAIGSRDYTRTVANVGKSGAGFAALAAGIADFMPVAHGQAMHDIDKDNERLRRHATILQQTSPKEVEEAVRTGDYSKLPQELPDQHIRGDFVNTLKSLTGSSQANDWAQDPTVLGAISTSLNPEQTRADLLREETKGMDPIQAEYFLARAKERTEEDVTKTRTAHVMKQQEELLTAASSELMSSLTAGKVITTDDYMRHMSDFASAGAITGPQGRMDALYDMDQQILEQAIVYGNSKAMYLASVPIPERDGLSLMQIYKDEAEKLDNEAETRVGDEMSAAHRQTVFDLQTEIADGKVGHAAALARIATIEETYAPSTTTNAMKDAARAALGKAAESADVFGAYMEGQRPARGDINKHQFEHVRNWPALMESYGITDPQQQAAHLSRYLQEYEPDGDTKSWLGQMLRSDDPLERDFTVAVLDSMDPYKTPAMLSAADGRLYSGVRAATRAGVDMNTAFEKIATAEPSDIAPARQLAERFGMNTEAKDKFVKAGVEQTVALAEKTGKLLTGDTLMPFNTPSVDSEVSHEFENAAQEFLHSGIARTPEEASAIAADAMSDRLEMSLRNGELVVVLRPEITNTLDVKSGEVKTYAPLTDQAIDTALTELAVPTVGFTKKAPVNPRFAGRSGVAPQPAGGKVDTSIEITGLRSDELTPFNKGYAIQHSPDGVSVDMVLVPGETMWVSAERRNTDLFKFFPVVESAKGEFLVQVPSQDLPIGGAAAWVEDNGVLRARYIGTEFDADAAAANLNALSGQQSVKEPLYTGRRAVPTTSAPSEKPLPTPGRATMGTQPDAPAAAPAAPESEPRSERSTYKPRASRDYMRRTMTEMLPPRVDRKARSQVQARHPNTIEDAEKIVNDAVKQSDARATFLVDWSTPEGAKFQEASLTFITEHEGFVPYVYDDHSRARVTPGKPAKGDPTVGIGYNLKNPTAREDLKSVGVDMDALVAGKVELTEKQARALASIHLKRVTRWLHKHFEGHRESIPQHRWIALTSLGYNSRWNKNGPTLIGPKLTAATIAGDVEAARFEIEKRSGGGVPKHLDRGIGIRRRKEFRMWEGKWDESTTPTS